MSFRHGKNTKVLIGSNDLSSYFKDTSFSSSIGTSETTTYGTSGASKTYVVGLNDATLSLGGLFDGDASAVDEYIASILGSSTDVIYTVAPDNGMNVGSRCFSGQSIATKYDVKAPVGDVVSISADFQIDAETARGVILAPLSSVSATGNGTAVDNAASTTNGGTAIIHVTTNTRNGAITVKVQHSVDNSTWADLASFTSVPTSTKTSERLVVAAGTTVNRYLRATYTVAGSSGSATIAVTFGRRN